MITTKIETASNPSFAINLYSKEEWQKLFDESQFEGEEMISKETLELLYKSSFVVVLLHLLGEVYNYEFFATEKTVKVGSGKSAKEQTLVKLYAKYRGRTSDGVNPKSVSDHLSSLLSLKNSLEAANGQTFELLSERGTFSILID